MQEHMKKPHTKEIAKISWRNAHYHIPLTILNKYRVNHIYKHYIPPNETFSDILKEQHEPSLILKALRTRKGLSQIELAREINISQQNLSAMENGQRTIGKTLAKRIANKFSINYRWLL